MKALQEPNKGKGGKKFTPFTPKIRWSDDGEIKFILILNPVEDIPTLQMHEWVKVGMNQNGKARYEDFIYRKDPAIGEDYDDLEDRLDLLPRERTLAVAVELEPTYTEVKGRKRPTGFEVKTESFERRTEEDVEIVTAPIIGIVSQSRFNFFGWVGSFNDSTAPIEETPLQVLRRGKDASTDYDFTPFIDQPVDFSNLIDGIGNVNYLRDVDMGIDGLDEDAAALKVGSALLEKYLNELADADRYKDIVGPLDFIESAYQKKDGAKEKPAAQAEESNGASKRPSKFDRLREQVESQPSN
jgi:hypothetical protein